MSDYRSRKITLPGGREIEIVYLGDVRPAATPAGLAGQDGVDLDRMVEAALSVFEAPTAELWMCDGCGSDLVYPESVAPTDDGRWHIERSCPQCDRHDAGVYERADVEEFHDAIEEGIEEMLSALQQMARLNMEDDVERLVRAIHAGLIQPEDF